MFRSAGDGAPENVHRCCRCPADSPQGKNSIDAVKNSQLCQKKTGIHETQNTRTIKPTIMKESGGK
jgi:hypothetical protein